MEEETRMLNAADLEAREAFAKTVSGWSAVARANITEEQVVTGLQQAGASKEAAEIMATSFAERVSGGGVIDIQAEYKFGKASRK